MLDSWQTLLFLIVLHLTKSKHQRTNIFVNILLHIFYIVADVAASDFDDKSECTVVVVELPSAAADKMGGRFAHMDAVLSAALFAYLLCHIAGKEIEIDRIFGIFVDEVVRREEDIALRVVVKCYRNVGMCEEKVSQRSCFRLAEGVRSRIDIGCRVFAWNESHLEVAIEIDPEAAIGIFTSVLTPEAEVLTGKLITVRVGTRDDVECRSAQILVQTGIVLYMFDDILRKMNSQLDPYPLTCMDRSRIEQGGLLCVCFDIFGDRNFDNVTILPCFSYDIDLYKVWILFLQRVKKFDTFAIGAVLLSQC